MRKLRHEEIPRIESKHLIHVQHHPVTVILDNIRSLHNVGSIFRTSDAALIEKLCLTGITGTPNNRALHKTALGAQDTVKWTYEKDARTTATKLKEAGYTLAVLEITDTPSSTQNLPASVFPLCLIVGNELSGVQDDLITMADMALEIPQYGTKQSLNVAVAYGIAIFDIIRSYRNYHAATS